MYISFSMGNSSQCAESLRINPTRGRQCIPVGRVPTAAVAVLFVDRPFFHTLVKMHEISEKTVADGSKARKGPIAPQAWALTPMVSQCHT